MSFSNGQRPHTTPPALLWFGALLVALGLAVLVRIASADDARKPTALQLALALDVARTAVNEASLSARPRDVALIYEATRYHGDNDAARLAWLRSHSRCTNPDGDCNRDGRVDARDDRAAARRPGNARWTRGLAWTDDKPDGFSDAWRWHPERWNHARRFALGLVMTDEPTSVCGAGVAVRTWGRPGDFRARPGLVPVDCGARNLAATTRAHRQAARRIERRRGYMRAISLDASASAR